MTSQLHQLQQHSIIVADTGDIASIARLRPEDATTNPSLIVKAAAQPEYAHIIEEGITHARHQAHSREERLAIAVQEIAVGFGVEILKHIPGVVSTEVDARLSFDTMATVHQARQLIQRYALRGIGRDRVLIKIASTWEGIQAAALLEKEGIRCNLTLLFGFAQAQACAEANVTLISPFVGRILDWYKKAEGRDFTPAEDPGVHSVKALYDYYKATGCTTIVMGASFRNTGEIAELAGCDKLTISPQLLAELAASDAPLPRRLASTGSKREPLPVLDEKTFRWQMNENAMATEKLAEGIRLFAADLRKLEASLAERL